MLAFVLGTFSSQDVINEIGSRGITFVPDKEFLDAVKAANAGPGIPEAAVIKGMNAKIAEQESQQRMAAYHILLAAVEDKRKRDFASADQKYQAALQLAPDCPTLHLASAKNLLSMANYREAERESRTSLQLWADDAEAHVILASSLLGENRPDEAVAEARLALNLFPKHSGALVMLGMALTRSRQYNEAVPVLRQAMLLAPEIVSLHRDLGESLFHLGDTDEAIEELSLFLQRNPNNAEGHYYLGVCFRAKGRQSDAEAEFGEAARLAPNNPLYASVAGADSAPKAGDPSGPQPDAGSISGDTYTNQFFGFTYQFPKGWTILEADDARAAARFGGTLLANGDPTLRDAEKAASAYALPLLFVKEGYTKEGAISVQSIQIQALNTRVEPISSALDFLRKSAEFLRHQGHAVDPVGEPQEFQVGGKSFGRLNLAVHIATGVASESLVVLLDKGYLLMFVFTAPDDANRDELLQTMQTLRFFEK